MGVVDRLILSDGNGSGCRPTSSATSAHAALVDVAPLSLRLGDIVDHLRRARYAIAEAGSETCRSAPLRRIHFVVTDAFADLVLERGLTAGPRAAARLLSAAPERSGSII